MKVAFKPVVPVDEEVGEESKHWGVIFIVHELKEGDKTSRYYVADLDDDEAMVMIEAGRVTEWTDDAAKTAVVAAAKERPIRRIRRAV